MKVTESGKAKASQPAPDYTADVSRIGPNKVATVTFDDVNEVGPRVSFDLGVTEAGRENLIKSLQALDDPNTLLKPVLDELGGPSGPGVRTDANKTTDVVGGLVTLFNPPLGIVGWLIAKGFVATSNDARYGETLNPLKTWGRGAGQSSEVRNPDTEGGRKVQAGLMAMAEETKPSET